MPVQRIPRYILLLTDYLKSTPADNQDSVDVKKALTIVKDVATKLNQNKREHETRLRLETLKATVSGEIPVCIKNTTEHKTSTGLLFVKTGWLMNRRLKRRDGTL
mgnify:CR=1 FL=1